MPFPPQLGSLKSKLVLLDSHVAGLVSTYLSGGKVDPMLVTYDHNFDKLLESFRPRNEQEKSIWEEYKQYKTAIDELTRLLAACIGKRI
jgi:hypothetical protein